MIIALVIFFVALVTKLVIDYNLWLKGRPNKHILGPALVLIALVGCSWIVGWLSAPMWCFGWWAIFDTIFALLLGQKWNWTGTTAKLDKLQAKYPVIKWAKYIGVPVSIIIFIVWLK